MQKTKKVLKFLKDYGMNVYEINDLEKTDEKIKELIDKEYSTIILTNEVANFSQDIIKKYNKMQDINIIIASKKDK